MIQRKIKRGLDIILSLVALTLLSWLMVILALWIRWDSKGPAFYVQTRIGRHGQPFKMWKFRTMQVGADIHWTAPSPDEALTYRFQDHQDWRITRLGKWLRRTSLDELPQLWNVLTGSMSLVGPRPEIPEMVALYPAYAHARHNVQPGITGLAQIMGRGDLTLEETLQWDLWYCEHWTLWLDVRILFGTIASVFKRQGAY
ncbi:sugar transferase [Sulfobacillus sp. hq2]|uniref:Sugar transferase n=1 Tax=Sulfobacillus thermotolerans TaxID=338644 RepID=A0ABM6RV51_9FIRM|nr:sugar transferase [Sulfobacillus sp. hq2]AUW95093.1 sugar transferase [Sulfobacillus thermotolerans]MCY0908611.1 sugar transferase [Sulfobacillus thermotolerans]POB10302.1 sugar transferase [Sulfobacillus sp. hq2]